MSKIVNHKEMQSTETFPFALHICRNVIGCKWTLLLLWDIAAGNNRPGTLRRGQRSLSVRVLNDHLRRLLGADLISRVSYPETPPRVEYSLTDRGNRLLQIIREIERLDNAESCRDTPDEKKRGKVELSPLPSRL
ncbi:transcriptional regulator [Verrucomicrobia bacterium LW23]|nr:transcriptional regulator [Verrucomicrobia bacterium LW23]